MNYVIRVYIVLLSALEFILPSHAQVDDCLPGIGWSACVAVFMECGSTQEFDTVAEAQTACESDIRCIGITIARITDGILRAKQCVSGEAGDQATDVLNADRLPAEVSGVLWQSNLNSLSKPCRDGDSVCGLQAGKMPDFDLYFYWVNDKSAERWEAGIRDKDKYMWNRARCFAKYNELCTCGDGEKSKWEKANAGNYAFSLHIPNAPGENCPDRTEILTMEMDIGTGERTYSFQRSSVEDLGACTDPQCRNIRYVSIDPSGDDVYLYWEKSSTNRNGRSKPAGWNVGIKRKTRTSQDYEWNWARCRAAENRICKCDARDSSWGWRAIKKSYLRDYGVNTDDWKVLTPSCSSWAVETQQSDKRFFHKSGWWIYGLVALVLVGIASVVAKWLRSRKESKQEFQIGSVPMDQDALEGLSGKDIEIYADKTDAVKLVVHTDDNESHDDDQGKMVTV